MRLVAVGAAAFLAPCLPTPTIDPPVAHIEVTCVSSDCLVIELSSLESEGADDVEWTIDGTFYGVDDVITIDVPERGLVEMVLDVSNSAGTDSDLQYMFTTEVSNTATTNRDIMASVVATGGNVCNSLSVISTVGGCFSDTVSAPLEHVVSRLRGGVLLLSTLEYDPVANDVTNRGSAVAAVWKRSTAAVPNLIASPASVLGDYGPRPKRLRNVVGPNQDHLTSYYPISNGDILTFDLGHGAYLGDEALTPLDSLTLDCSSGVMVVTAVPVVP